MSNPVKTTIGIAAILFTTVAVADAQQYELPVIKESHAYPVRHPNKLTTSTARCVQVETRVICNEKENNGN